MAKVKVTTQVAAPEQPIVGKIVLPPPPISMPWRSAAEPVKAQTMDPPMFFPAVQDFANLLTALRAVRSNQMFVQANCHTFREWCMNHFGEKLGGWIDDVI